MNCQVGAVFVKGRLYKMILFHILVFDKFLKKLITKMFLSDNGSKTKIRFLISK